jgi:acyl-CoA synthetase (AMP-forming)/AMP-acid ligase II
MIYNQPSSILDFLTINATTYSTETAYIFYDAADIASEINFSQLKEEVGRISLAFFKILAEPKSRVLIIIPPGLNFIVSFLGVL